MGLFGRIISLGKGKANDAVDELEARNLETVVNQTNREAEAQLRKTIELSAKAAAESIRLENQLDDLKKQQKDWGKKAEKAVNADNDELAVKALEKQTEVENQIAALKPTVENAVASRIQLEKSVEKMKAKISKNKQEAKTLVARHQAAEAQKALAQAATGVGESGNAFAKLERLKGVVEENEAEAQAYGNMAGNADEDLEDAFAALETSSANDKLAALKAKKGK